MAAITKPSITMLLANPKFSLHLDSFLDNKQSARNKRICKAFSNSITFTLQQRNIVSTGVFKVIEEMKSEHFLLPSTMKNGYLTLRYQSFERLASSRKKVMENLRATVPFIKVFDMSEILIDVDSENYFYIIGQKEFQELCSMRFPNVTDLVVRLPKPLKVRQFKQDEEVTALTPTQIKDFAKAFPNVVNLEITEGVSGSFLSILNKDEIVALLTIPDNELIIPRLPKKVSRLTFSHCKYPYNEQFSQLLKGIRNLESISIERGPFEKSDIADMVVCFKDLPLHSLSQGVDMEYPTPNLDQAFQSLIQLKKLRSLTLGGALTVTVEAMKVFAAMPGLTCLNTGFNNFGEDWDPHSLQGIQALARSNSLTELTMNYWAYNRNSERLAGIVAELPKIKLLRILHFGDSVFPQNFGESLAKCQHLEELYLTAYVSIKDKDLISLKDVPNLTKIVFEKREDYTAITTKGFETLVKESKKLRVLDIQYLKNIDPVEIYIAANQVKKAIHFIGINILKMANDRLRNRRPFRRG